MPNAIEIKSLSVTISEQPVLKKLSADIPEGKVVGLLGPSGAGKTTLIRVIVGRQRITSGSVKMFGHPAGAPDLRPDIGYMTQSPAVYPDLTVAENVQYFAQMRGCSKAQVYEVIEHVDLKPFTRHLFANLSGGQKSRVSLAIALLGSPKLLVLDEPTVGVDPVLRRQLWQLFAALAQQGTTLLISSHVMDEADHCQELLLIRDGSLITSGSPKKLRQQTGSTSIDESFLKLVEKKK